MHRKRFRIPVVLLVLILFLSLPALLSSRGIGEGRNGDEGWTIGLAMQFLRDDYAQGVVKGAHEAAEEIPGTEIIVTDANLDAQKQLTDVENLIAREVDAICLVPIDEKAILPAIEKANKKEIPVVTITSIPGAEVLSTIAASGDYVNGKASANIIVNKLNGTGKVAVLTLGWSLYRIDERLKGFRDALKGTEITIVAEQAANDDRIQDTARSILTAHPDLDAFWCTYGLQIIGASDAVRAAGRKDIVITGIDAEKGVIERIKEGWVTAAAAQYPIIHGKLAVEAALKKLQGESVQEVYEAPIGIVDISNADTMYKEIWGE